MKMMRFVLLAFGMLAVAAQAASIPIGEAGSVTVSQTDSNQWHTVTLSRTYSDPIIVMGPPSYSDTNAVTLRVRSVQAGQFEFQLDEWDYQDGTHGSETIGYLVLEQGTYNLTNGIILQAGAVAGVGEETWSTVQLSPSFTEAPVVLSQCVSVNEDTAVATRLRNVSVTSFQVCTQEQESPDDGHLAETVHWIAMNVVSNGMPGGVPAMEVDRTGTVVDEVWETLTFHGSYAAPPVFLADMQTYAGSDSTALRCRNPGTASVEVYTEEEQSKDTEIGHANEAVGYLALEPGFIYLTDPPVITTQPANDTVTEPLPAVFEAAATGREPLSYQWRRDGVAINGAVHTIHTLWSTSAAGDDGATFDVIVSNAAGVVTSAVATLTVNQAPAAPPVIHTEPADCIVFEPRAAEFAAVVTARAPVTYSWYRNGTLLLQTPGPTLSYSPTTAIDDGVQFSLVVSNFYGAVTSRTARLTVHTPDEIPSLLEASGVQGGLVVTVGETDGRVTEALYSNDSYLVHGLVTDETSLAPARTHIRSLGLYGPVSIDRLPAGYLPYTDGCVNLLVLQANGLVSDNEIQRVLAPEGVVCRPEAAGWDISVKPRPANMGEWTHALHGPNNNACTPDDIVGPPRHLQWVAPPRSARSHEHLASVSASVSSGGRVFYIIDEGPLATVAMDPQWALYGRDAFSGVKLWRRDIPDWEWHLRAFRSGPNEIARRLVAKDDQVYTTLGWKHPVSQLDAATGEILQEYAGTTNTMEIALSDGILFLVCGDDTLGADRPAPGEEKSQYPAYNYSPPFKHLIAVDAASGTTLWTKDDADTHDLLATTLAVQGGRVYFQNYSEIVCLNAATGGEVWRSPRATCADRYAWAGPTLVVYEENGSSVVLSADRLATPVATARPSQLVTAKGTKNLEGEMIGFDALDGTPLWTNTCYHTYNSAVDVLVVDGLVWIGQVGSGGNDGYRSGYNPFTGALERSLPEQATASGMHHRCYRNKAAGNYLLMGRYGVDLIDVVSGSCDLNAWTRGTCQYGILAGNGLIYVPQHSCACFLKTGRNGFNAYAPARAQPVDTSPRLEEGPAYSDLSTQTPLPPETAAWPTYRNDAARSGYTVTPVGGTDLKLGWQRSVVPPGRSLSPPVVAGQRVFVVDTEQHQLHVLSASTGEPLWSFTAGGRIDSPPTIWNRSVLFGSADGYVYCLRADDGALGWRFRAASSDLRLVSYEQVESVWPVQGSVMVHDDAAYFVAGRSHYLDGGMTMFKLDVATGAVIAEEPVSTASLPDVLSTDGSRVYLRNNVFSMDCVSTGEQRPHLFSTVGFMDGLWWHRTYWRFGQKITTGWSGWIKTGDSTYPDVPAGRMLVVNGDKVYGFGRNAYAKYGAHIGINARLIFQGPHNKDEYFYNRLFCQQDQSTYWTNAWPADVQIPVTARSLILADDTLLAAGPLPIMGAEVEDPAAAFAGEEGGVLLALDATDGSQQAAYELPAPPVFDGMAAAYGCLYMSTQDGQVMCFGAQADLPVALTKLKIISLLTDQINMNWYVKTGYTYRLQYKERMGDPTWQNLGDPISGTDEMVEIDVPSDVGKCFFRLLIESE